MKNDMTQGNIARALTAFTVPLILSGAFQQLFNWADAFIVGNVEGELWSGPPSCRKTVKIFEK